MTVRVRTTSPGVETNKVNLLFGEYSGFDDTLVTNNLVGGADDTVWTEYDILATELPANWTNSTLSGCRPYLVVRGDFFAKETNYVQCEIIGHFTTD